MTLTVVDGRLPAIAIPSHYAVTYHRIDLVAHTFEGQVVLDLTSLPIVPSHSSSLVIHARELQLSGAALKEAKTQNQDKEGGDCVSFDAVEFRYQLHHQTCEIVFPPGFEWKPSTPYQLTMHFSGILNDVMAGLYRSSYVNLQNQTVTMATTQFEPTDARRAFPCFDEPALKATFQLSVQRIPAHLQVISNTPVISSHTSYYIAGDDDNKHLVKTVTFDTTPKMSTYLVALVIGEFDAVSCTSSTSQIQTTVYTVPGKAHQGTFCLDTASRCLDFLQEIYGIPYPLRKSDLLAIPDFASGAMENWGCVTYREAKILVNEESTSETMRRGIARTVCHELAHQWFGNLVTPEFWTQLWLKEGVARFMEFIALDHLFPEWNAWDEFVQSVYNLALSLDSLESSHPVEVQVHHSDEINEVFDAISYAKGASIIRMLFHYIGQEDFMRGMRLYLTRHAYSNSVSEDFWTALSEVSGKPLVQFMEHWTKVTGFPLLQLQSDGSVTTDRFYASGAKVGNHAADARPKWPMPVTARVEGSDKILGPWVIDGPERDESADLLQQIQSWSSQNKWFKLNADQMGFYHVDYTPEQWSRLALAMDPVKCPLSATDRLGLISDSFAVGKAGYGSIVDSLNLVKGFGDHDVAEYVVWQELSSNLASLASLYRSESFYPNFQEYLRKLFAKQAERLGWDASPKESARTGSLRGAVLKIMGIAEDPTVLEEAYRRFLVVTKSDSPEGAVPGDIQQVLFRLALRQNEATVFDNLKRMFEEKGNELSPGTQRDILITMGCVKDGKRHSEMLDYVFFSGKVRQQDMAFPLGSLTSASDEGGRAAWEYFKRNYDKLHSKLGTGFLWRDCVGLCSRGLKTAAEAQEVEDFFNEPHHPAGSGTRRLQQALEVVRTSAARIERDRKALMTFFQG